MHEPKPHRNPDMEKYNFYLFIYQTRECMNEIEKIRAVNAEKGVLQITIWHGNKTVSRTTVGNGWLWGELQMIYNDEKWLQDIIFYQLHPNGNWNEMKHQRCTASFVCSFVRSYMKCHKIFGIKECELKEYKYIPIYSIWSSHVLRVSLQNGLQNSNGQCVCMLSVCVSSCSYFT